MGSFNKPFFLVSGARTHHITCYRTVISSTPFLLGISISPSATAVQNLYLYLVDHWASCRKAKSIFYLIAHYNTPRTTGC